MTTEYIELKVFGGMDKFKAWAERTLVRGERFAKRSKNIVLSEGELEELDVMFDELEQVISCQKLGTLPKYRAKCLATLDEVLADRWEAEVYGEG